MDGVLSFETEVKPGLLPPPGSARTFLGGKISTFTLKSVPVKVSVFCPKSAVSAREVDILVYAHGLLGSCAAVANPPEGLITGSAFKLGPIVNASGRPTVLVVPLFDWSKPGFHMLGKPGNLNRLIAEVIQKLAAMRGGAAPSLGKLMLAGHSRGYDFLEPLARSFQDPQMSQGALAKLSAVWAFDTTYALNVKAWLAWLAAKPGLRAVVFYRRNTRPAARPVGTMKAGDALYAARNSGLGRLSVIQISAETGEGHCQVPVNRLPALLDGSGTATVPAVPLPAASSLKAQIVKVALAELNAWGKGTKKETDPAMRSTLTRYWGAVLTSPAAIKEAIDKRSAWSAAFISWVMKQAGAGASFHPSSAHTRYVAVAKKARLAADRSKFQAYRAADAMPEPGDLICVDRKPPGRTTCAGVSYDNVEKGGTSHSDIVLSIDPATRKMTLVGGNVNNSVATKAIQLTADGHLPPRPKGACGYIAILKAPGSVAVTPSAPPKPSPPKPSVPTPATTSVPTQAPTSMSGGCKEDRCTSGYIRWVQDALNKTGARLGVNGRLDDATLKAILNFKRRTGLKTKETYIGPNIERALIGAGAGTPPPLAKLPCGATPQKEMIALLEKYRKDIPLEILLGWIQIESGMQIGSSTSICERGYFQLHPGNSIELKLDHDRLGTDKEYSVAAGIALVNQCRKYVDALKVPGGSDLYWHLVKLCHWLPSGPRKLLAAMRQAGVEPRDWPTVRSFALQRDEALKPVFSGRRPSQGTQNVDHMFQQVEAWRRKLAAGSN